MNLLVRLRPHIFIVILGAFAQNLVNFLQFPRTVPNNAIHPNYYPQDQLKLSHGRLGEVRIILDPSCNRAQRLKVVIAH